MEFIDLKAQYRALKTEIDANIQTVLDSAQFIGGPQVKELEARLAEDRAYPHDVIERELGFQPKSFAERVMPLILELQRR